MHKRLLVFTWSLLLVSWAWSQEADTTTYTLESIVVTADRSASLLGQSTAAVSAISGAALRQMPGVVRLGDALRQMPGFALLSIDGQGLDPQITVRGFYGGGETEYLLVLVDGRPLNNMEMGLINWSQVPLSAIRAVEVIRGGASSLYGDAAVGGVLNIVTHQASAESDGARFSFTTGSFRTYHAEGSANTRVGTVPVSVFGNVLRTAGFREHSARTAGSAGTSIGLVRTGKSEVGLSVMGNWRRYDVPGPLTTAELSVSRVQPSPFFRFDNMDESTWYVSADGRRKFSPSVSLRGSISGDWRNAAMVRTLPLASVFADTKERTVTSSRIFGSAQLEVLGVVFSADKLVAGVDSRFGELSNTYYNMLTGSFPDYAEFSGQRGDISTQGEGSRNAVAGFVQYDLVPHPRLRFTLGARYDAISDRYTPTGQAATDASHSAFSPKVGVNVAFARSTKYVGHVYANYLGIFKAATMDQLFDQRLLPVPFPPFSITISNHELKPQSGQSYEAGLYQRLRFSPTVSLDWTLSAYQVDMKDELDFSFETFSYANIASSKHRGLESGLRLQVGSSVAAYSNYTFQRVTYEEGSHKGNFVKGIPRDYLNVGVQSTLPFGLSVGAVLHATARMYLDDGNTQPLDDYTTLDAVVAYQWRNLQLKLDATNLLGATYSTTGFPDPDASSDSGIVFLYPAAGRALRVGVSVTL